MVVVWDSLKTKPRQISVWELKDVQHILFSGRLSSELS
jgi:hypothetical protein